MTNSTKPIGDDLLLQIDKFECSLITTCTDGLGQKFIICEVQTIYFIIKPCMITAWSYYDQSRYFWWAFPMSSLWQSPVLSDLISHINITQIAEYLNVTKISTLEWSDFSSVNCLYAFLLSLTQGLSSLFLLHNLIIKSCGQLVFHAWFALRLCNPVTRADLLRR